MKPKKRVKALIITLCTVVVLAGAGFGGWYFLQNREQEPVNVYSFEYLGMTEYWGDSQESYGPVTTDRIQTVFVSDTQTVTEVLVQAGDTVKRAMCSCALIRPLQILPWSGSGWNWKSRN